MQTHKDEPQQYTDGEVIAAAGQLPPEYIPRQARLRYFKRLIATGPEALWALLKLEDRSSKSWMQMLRDDISWMQQTIPERVPSEDPSAEAEHWANFIRDNKSWKALTRGAGKRAAAFFRIEVDTDSWKKDFLQACELGGIQEVKMQEHGQSDYQCHVCQQAFATRRQRGAHMCIMHGLKRIERHFFHGTHCPACLKEYHCRTRLFRHLAYTQGSCFQVLQMTRKGMELETLEELEGQEAKKLREKKHKGIEPEERSQPVFREKAGPVLGKAWIKKMERTEQAQEQEGHEDEERKEEETEVRREEA